MRTLLPSIGEALLLLRKAAHGTKMARGYCPVDRVGEGRGGREVLTARVRLGRARRGGWIGAGRLRGRGGREREGDFDLQPSLLLFHGFRSNTPLRQWFMLISSMHDRRVYKSNSL